VLVSTRLWVSGTCSPARGFALRFTALARQPHFALIVARSCSSYRPLLWGSAHPANLVLRDFAANLRIATGGANLVLVTYGTTDQRRGLQVVMQLVRTALTPHVFMISPPAVVGTG
jgi:hypothetical protein